MILYLWNCHVIIGLTGKISPYILTRVDGSIQCTIIHRNLATPSRNKAPLLQNIVQTTLQDYQRWTGPSFDVLASCHQTFKDHGSRLLTCHSQLLYICAEYKIFTLELFMDHIYSWSSRYYILVTIGLQWPLALEIKRQIIKKKVFC